MNLLIVGGSGLVGTMVLPTLKRKHKIRILDLKPPKNKSVDYIEGMATDPEAVELAIKGMDAVLYMAMGSLDWQEWSGIDSSFDANVKGLYFVLKAAADEGITQAVYTSSLSVYSNLEKRYFSDEGITPDETDLYGFTKRLGEDVCENAWRAWGINTNALRLCFPTPKEKWLKKHKKGKATIATMDSDVGKAMLAALEYKGGFQSFMISGDYEHKLMNMSKAKRLLGWTPKARPIK